MSSERIQKLEDDIDQAQKLYVPKSNWIPKSLALHTQAVIQGAFILAKASQNTKEALESLDHLKNYVKLLFKNNSTKQQNKKGESNV
jgi:TetR/AcrR family transcriptional repressor of nem operon